jgi:hypothetical protein
VFEDRVLRKTFWAEEVPGNIGLEETAKLRVLWCILYTEYCTSAVIKPRVGWAGHVASMGEEKVHKKC